MGTLCVIFVTSLQILNYSPKMYLRKKQEKLKQGDCVLLTHVLLHSLVLVPRSWSPLSSGAPTQGKYLPHPK